MPLQASERGSIFGGLESKKVRAPSLKEGQLSKETVAGAWLELLGEAAAEARRAIIGEMCLFERESVRRR